jgi:hypothetical protein
MSLRTKRCVQEGSFEQILLHNLIFVRLHLFNIPYESQHMLARRRQVTLTVDTEIRSSQVVGLGLGKV